MESKKLKKKGKINKQRSRKNKTRNQTKKFQRYKQGALVF
jgi:hypothetical protein